MERYVNNFDYDYIYVPRPLGYADYRIHFDQVPKTIKILSSTTDHNPLVAVLEPALEVSVDLSPFSHEACPEHYHNLIMSTTIIALPLSLNAGYTQDVMVPFIHLNSVMRDGRCIGQVKVSALGTDLAPGQYRLKLRLIDLEVLKENGLETATLATKVSDQLKIIVEEW